VTVYSEDGERMFGFGEWGNFDMGAALVIALSNWKDERMKDLTIGEIQRLRND